MFCSGEGALKRMPAPSGGGVGGQEPKQSVLRVRADCGSRLFTAKLGVVVHICRINCSITCWRMKPSCWLVSSATVFAIVDDFICFGGIDFV